MEDVPEKMSEIEIQKLLDIEPEKIPEIDLEIEPEKVPEIEPKKVPEIQPEKVPEIDLDIELEATAEEIETNNVVEKQEFENTELKKELME